MVGWHHRLHGREFEQAPGVGDGQGGVACCGPWGHRESRMTEQLNGYRDPTPALRAAHDTSPTNLSVHDPETVAVSVCFHRRKVFLYFLFHKERNKEIYYGYSQLVFLHLCQQMKENHSE